MKRQAGKGRAKCASDGGAQASSSGRGSGDSGPDSGRSRCVARLFICAVCAGSVAAWASAFMFQTPWRFPEPNLGSSVTGEYIVPGTSHIPEYVLQSLRNYNLGFIFFNKPCSCHLEPLFQASAAVHRAEGWDQQQGRWRFTLSFTRLGMICRLNSHLNTRALVGDLSRCCTSHLGRTRCASR